MATFYIQLQDKLQKISGDLTAANITKALGYTPSAFSGDYNELNNAPITDNSNGEFDIVDESGNIIAKVNNQGVFSVDFVAGVHKLSEKANVTDLPSLEGYAKETWVSEEIAKAVTGGEDIDLSGYAKKTDLEGLASEQWVESKGYLTEHQDISNLATKDEIPSLDGYAKLDDIPEVPSLDGYATEQWVESKNYATKDEIPSADFNELANNPFTEDTSGELNMTDESGNIGFKLTNQGLYVKDVLAGDNTLSNKVDKVEGKGLSTEDFTTILKQKLEGLSNYDDTAISQAVDKLRTDLDALVSGDTTTAIKTFNEVIAFLDGIQDTQDLSGIIASIEQQIAGKMDKVTLATVATSGSYGDLSDKPTIPDVSNKQDKLVSGTNIKTINGTSLLGSGDIVISGGGGSEGVVSWDDIQGKPIHDVSLGQKDGSRLDTTAMRITTFDHCSTDAISFTRRGITFYDSYEFYWEIHKNGNGTKFLADNGQYKEVYTKAEIDTTIGDINTILESIING